MAPSRSLFAPAQFMIDSGTQCQIESRIRRSVAQPGSASDLGSEGRRFESYRSDHEKQYETRVASGFAGFLLLSVSLAIERFTWGLDLRTHKAACDSA